MQITKYRDIETGQEFFTLPKIYANRSPITEANYALAGLEQFTVEVADPVPPDDTEFQEACSQFKAVCAAIASNANLPGFKGGFDEMAVYNQSSFSATLPGLKLALAWVGANELCRYLGSKLGLGSPEWWYKCWDE